MNLLPFALEYHKAGLSVIPFSKVDGKVKFPIWEKYQLGQTEVDIKNLFSGEVDGICLICSNGIEAIDIDVKHDPCKTIDREFFDYVKMYSLGEEALKKCVIQKTKNAGWHIIYKTEISEGNQKLAHRAGSKEAVIETRAKGGLLFIYPTPGYEIKRGGICKIEKIEDSARDTLIRCAREMSTRDEIKQPERHIPNAFDITPGDDFNQQHDVLDTAEKYGWKVISRHGGKARLTRPGSQSGDVHASIIQTKQGESRFYPFTTSTQYDANKCYSPFSMYAIEEHRGDFKEAASALSKLGFGKSSGSVPGRTPEEKNDLISKALRTKYDFHAPIKKEDAILTLNVDGHERKVGGFGQIGIYIGHEKSGKSFVLSCTAASCFGPPQLGFTLDLRGKELDWYDTEQSEYFYNVNQQRIHQMAELRTNARNYSAFSLRRFSSVERLEIIEHRVKANKNLGVLVIDGLVDLMQDYNSLPETILYVNKLMSWSYDYGILILGVLHLNKGDGKIRGHIGSELKNKCDFIINVAKNECEYTLTNPASRYGEFKALTFTRDEYGMPVFNSNMPKSVVNYYEIENEFEDAPF